MLHVYSFQRNYYGDIFWVIWDILATEPNFEIEPLGFNQSHIHGNGALQLRKPEGCTYYHISSNQTASALSRKYK
jgi:hypothetical protein